MRIHDLKVIKSRNYFGRSIELVTWQMKTATGGYAASYYYGADLLFVRYADTETEAIELVDKEVDDMVDPKGL